MRRHPSLTGTALLVLLLGLLVVPANAAAASCSMSVGAPGFGAIPQLRSTPTDTQATVSVTCALAVTDVNGISATVKLGAGNAGSALNRYMSGAKSEHHHLAYNLFADLSHSSIWGDGTNGAAPVVLSFSYNAANAAQNISATQMRMIYASVPPLATQTVADTYMDVILVTVDY